MIQNPILVVLTNHKRLVYSKRIRFIYKFIIILSMSSFPIITKADIKREYNCNDDYAYTKLNRLYKKGKINILKP